MPSQEEFESISKILEDMLSEKGKKIRAKEEKEEKEAAALYQEMQAMIVEKEQEILKQENYNKGTSSPPKPNILPLPDAAPRGYFIPEGTEIYIPVNWPTGKKVFALTDFVAIATTKDVRYDPEELVFDVENDLSELPANIGVWADAMLGFELPPNDKNVEFFLVNKRWVDILQEAGYNDMMAKWLKEVLKQTSKSMDMSSTLRGI